MDSSKKKILIVDDDPDIVFVLQAMLEDAGYTVATTGNGEDLARLQESHLPDLVVLDMLLSGTDGREMTKHLKSRAETKHVPILMISAHPSAEQEVRASGADDFLAKPFEMDELLAKIAKYLNEDL